MLLSDYYIVRTKFQFLLMQVISRL